MLGKMFGIICLISIIGGIMLGNGEALANGILDGAAGAVTLTISLCGIMSLRCGIMRVLERAGVIEKLAALLSPMLRKFFPDAYKTGEGIGEISANISANLLGIGNAATPFALKAMEKVFAEKDKSASFIFTGSRVNAMKYIFAEKKYFYRQVEHLPLQKVDDTEITEHIVRGFMIGGKVVERELIMGACDLFRGQMWYLNHFTSICDTLTKGYINEGILMQALKSLLSIHEPRFLSIVDDLTDHQLSLLRAVLDGVTKFSDSDVIEKYGLNSSANVRRVKDALKKKEVITFNEKDEPVVLDPLFEYWVGKHYFGIR
jgi:hypothetical protein